METVVKNTQARWYTEFTDQYEILSKAIGLTEEQEGELKIFMLQLARDQYMAGNRSGIRWARAQESGNGVVSS